MPDYNNTYYGYTQYTPWYSQREKIKKVIIEDGVKNIGKYAFEGCSGLRSITIPNSVTNIEQYAFYNCYSLTSITIPNLVTLINDKTFYGCFGLASITIPNSVKYIGDYAFNGCYNLTSISLPKSVWYIGESAFSSCSGLTSITIPNSVTTIGKKAFSSCSGLSSITIPNSVKSIGAWAFDACSNLTSVTIPNSVTSIGAGAFNACSNLTSVTIPNSVTRIENYAFFDCKSLYSVTIPESVTTIGEGAFAFCSKLTSIIIPQSVTNIGPKAFQYINNMTSLTCEAIVPPTCNTECFANINKSIPVYVPASSVNAYKTASQWKDFTNIQPLSVYPNLTLALTDANTDLTEGYYKTEKVTYTRNNMTVGGYATFCLPFDIDLSNTTDNFSNVYVPLNISLCKPSGALLLLLDEVNSYSTIKAGQPFVAKCKTTNVTFKNSSDVSFEGTVSNPTSTNVKVYNFDGVSGALTQKTDVNVKIGGTFSKFTGLDDDYYRAFFSNGSFGPTTSVNPFRMYVYKNDNNSLGSKITSISFDFNDETTGIKELRTTNSELPVYDLNGRAVKGNNLKSGIYIINGKKYIK